VTNAIRLIAAGLVGTVAASCAPKAPPFHPRALQEDERQHATGQPTRQMRPLPTTLESPFLPTTQPGGAATTQPDTSGIIPPEGTEPTLRMPLQEVIQRAVANNLSVRVAGYNPAIEAARVVEADARFDPVLFAETAYESRDNQTGGQTIFDPTDPFADPIIANTDEAEILTARAGIRQTLPSGAEVELAYEASKNNFNPDRFAFDPYYESDLVLQITQPLLRDFGYEVNLEMIVIAWFMDRLSVFVLI
jgi:hypothetical protein